LAKVKRLLEKDAIAIKANVKKLFFRVRSCIGIIWGQGAGSREQGAGDKGGK
jgi:hypothetical protein